MPFPCEPGWDEALLRVESYLCAHRKAGRVEISRLAADILREAHARVRASAAEEPVGASIQVARARLGAWCGRAGGTGDWTDEQVRMRDRLALVLADAPGRWAGDFLAEGPVPPDLAAALERGVLQAGPELRFSNMAPAPLEFGFDEPPDGRGPVQSR